MKTKTLMVYRLLITTIMPALFSACNSNILNESETKLWNTDTLGCQFHRAEISRRLVESGELVGLSKGEIIVLLGNPDAETSSSIVYYTGRSWQCDSVSFTATQYVSMKDQNEPGDRTLLLINLDDEGRVVNATIPIQ